ncbi:ATP-binding protein [Nocardioides aquiterrae]|uniref:Histidine kinase/HSP90-like ATPase domain-containing protein n=1 Tax=Nocardioides aquiterrae TaxID=203799 RepID=A0ABN1UEP7_9ACTN
MSDRVTIGAPATPASIELVQTALATLWEQQPGVTARDRMRFETALVEVVGNVVEHAYALDQGTTPGSRQLELEISVDDSTIIALLSDDGRPADIDLGAVTMPDPEAESGRGLALAIAALDDLRYVHADGRNQWTLICVRVRP